MGINDQVNAVAKPDQLQSSSSLKKAINHVDVTKEKAYERAVQDLALGKAEASIKQEQAELELIRVMEKLALAKRRLVDIQTQNASVRVGHGHVSRVMQQLDETVADM